jgi:NADPH-dependent glutamate synthase beta subunit-like oxidoreductase
MAKTVRRVIFPAWENKVAPCGGESGCPARTNIAGSLYALSRGDIEQAWQIMMESHPFRAVLGRVCYAFCESPCNRGSFDTPISIQHLEMVIGDEGFNPDWKIPIEKLENPKKVAIIGAGPAGLSAAYYLARAGYNVEVFEKADKPGGMMRYGIPEYRLERTVLDREIDFILALGVTLNTGQNVDGGKLKSLSSLFDGVIVTTGAGTPVTADFDGSGKARAGLRFLQETQSGKRESLKGKSVVVIGGGNVAMDTCRTAVRLGAKSVTVVYRRTIEEMPAHMNEYEEALEEGVNFGFLLAPVSWDGGKAVFQRNRLSEPDESGRRKPEPIPGETEELEADILFTAIGQKPHEWKKTADNVFFAGDVLPGAEGTVIHAIADARRAADELHRKLSERKLFEEPAEEVTYDKMNIGRYYEKRMRLLNASVSASVRTGNFEQYINRVSAEEAVVEAERCFYCGTCVGGLDSSCDWCFHACPDDSMDKKQIEWTPDGALFEANENCGGCSKCWEYCPRYVVRPKEQEI